MIEQEPAEHLRDLYYRQGDVFTDPSGQELQVVNDALTDCLRQGSPTLRPDESRVVSPEIRVQNALCGQAKAFELPNGPQRDEALGAANLELLIAKQSLDRARL